MMNVRNMGPYNPKTEYRVGDVVTFEGGAFRYVQPVKGVSPNTNVRFDVWKRLNQDTAQAVLLMGGGSVDEVARERIDQLSEEMDDLESKFEIADKETEYPLSESGYLNKVGHFITSGGSCNTGYLSLNGAKKITYSLNLSDVAYIVAFFDESRQLMPDICVSGNGFTHGEIDVTGDAYANAKYVVASHYPTPSGEPYFAVFSVNSINDFLDKIESVSTKGKTALIFGDSITETATVSDDGSEYTEGTPDRYARLCGFRRSENRVDAGFFPFASLAPRLRLCQCSGGYQKRGLPG